MTLEELQANLTEINHWVVTFQTSMALEKYYAEDIVMIEGDGTVTTGKAACRQGREVFFRDMLVEFRESRLISQEIAVSADKTDELKRSVFQYAIARILLQQLNMAQLQTACCNL
jgi:hypothetical protein